MSLLLARVAALITCDDENRVLRDVDLWIEHGRIRAIGPGLRPKREHERIDASRLYVYPGLVNTHHHLFQAFVRNRAALAWPMDVLAWIDRIYPVFARLGEAAFFHSALVAIAELVKHGCTTVFDHQYCFPRGIGDVIVARQFEAAELLGVRLHVGRGANTLPPERGGILPEAMVESTAEFLASCERLADSFHESEPCARRRLVVAPCQPVNCEPASFQEGAALARDRGLRLHTHLGEGENETIRARHGTGSVAWCEAQDFSGEDVWVAHGWEFGAGEIAALAAAGTGVAHCPAPVFLVGQRITDVVAMAAAGVRLGLGVDGQASNDGSNLLECIRLAYLLQTLGAGLEDRPPPRPEDFLRYATVGGADLLGCPELGSLAPGQAADLFAVPVDRLDLVGALHDPLSLPAKVGLSGPVALTVVGGRIIWRDGEFPGLDEARLAREARAAVAALDIAL